jgi:hypothetical protein
VAVKKSVIKKSRRDDYDELSYLLNHCWDLPLLQTSKLARMPRLLNRVKEEKQGLEFAKVLRKELISCAEQITQRQRYSIDEIVAAIENKTPAGVEELQKIKSAIGVPFRRNKLDLARYYTVRLVMQGIDQSTISEFLEVDLRTVANYFAQGRERIRVILDTRETRGDATKK